MKTLQSYIKLAESAVNEPWRYEEGDHSHGYVTVQDSDDYTVAYQYLPRGMKSEDSVRLIPQYKFIAASRQLGPAMAKALIQAEDAIRQLLKAHDEQSEQWAREALSQIQALNGEKA